MELAGRSLFQTDRTAASDKTKDGGLARYIHNSWCTARNTIGKFCSPDLEYLTVKYRPFKLVRELSSVMIVVAYIPPQANVKLALEELYCLISSNMNAYPEAAVIMAGDFNHVK